VIHGNEIDFRGALGVEFRSRECLRDSLHIIAASLMEMVCQSFAKQVSNVEGIRVLEVPGRNPAIDSGGNFRRNHAPHNSVAQVSVFHEQYCILYVFP
jgi:hypothetical protein